MRTYLAVATLAVLVASPAVAQADVGIRIGGHARVSVGGHIRLGPAVRRVRRHRHHHHAQGAVVVGGGVAVYGGVFAEEPPPPPPPPVCCTVPSYYVPDSELYPVPPPAPAPVIVAQPAPRRHWFGVGLRGSSVDLDDGRLTGEGGGIFMRVRLGDRLELEADAGQDHYLDAGRTDTRVGTAAYLHLTRGALRPYLLLGLGANAIQFDGQTECAARQGFVEGGVGLAWKIGERFTVAGDVRVASRQLARDREECCRTLPATTTVTPPVADEESLAEARLAGIFYF